jgi:hypothetical protein
VALFEPLPPSLWYTWLEPLPPSLWYRPLKEFAYEDFNQINIIIIKIINRIKAIREKLSIVP